MNGPGNFAAAGYDYRRYKILFVDDEPQAREFFAEVFAEQFDVLTAADAENAWQIVEREGAQIGVVITDQRMPGLQGGDCLGRVKVRCPAVVRILTTAFADQSNAIEAVNRGGVFRYVTKPWDLDEVQGILMRAMEFFLIKIERDQLLGEKLHILQRLVVMDRVRGLATLAVALRGRLRRPCRALKAYIAQMPLSCLEATALHDAAGLDLRTLARTEAESLILVVQEVLATALPGFGEATPQLSPSGEEILDLPALMREILARSAEPAARLEVESVPPAGTVRGDAQLFSHLCELVLSRLRRLVGEQAEMTVRLQTARQDPSRRAVCLRFAAQAGVGGPSSWAPLFAAAMPLSSLKCGIEADLLPAFFLAHHHGATLSIAAESPERPALALEFSADTADAPDDRLDAPWFDRVFSEIEETQ